MAKNRTIEIDDLKRLADEWLNFSCKPSIKKMKSDEVIDEDKSVKWNREQVAKNNNEYETQVKNLNTEKNSRLQNFKNGCYEYIIQESGVSEDMAKKIYNYVYRLCKSYGLYTAIEEMDVLLDIFRD